MLLDNLAVSFNISFNSLELFYVNVYISFNSVELFYVNTYISFNSVELFYGSSFYENRNLTFFCRSSNSGWLYSLVYLIFECPANSLAVAMPHFLITFVIIIWRKEWFVIFFLMFTFFAYKFSVWLRLLPLV